MPEDEDVPCRGVMGVLFGHKFRARYDKKIVPPSEAVIKNILSRYSIASSSCAVIDEITNKQTIYRYDVCVRCGMIVGKEHDGSET